MMLANVFSKTIRDRWQAFTIASASIGVMTLFGMAVYSSIDLSLYNSLPEALRAMVGISTDTDAAGLAYGAIYGFIGAMTLAGLALWAGAASIAGEERSGTIGLLLGNPRSRTRVLLANAGAIVVLTAMGALILLVTGLLSPVILDVGVGGRDVTALVVHMAASALFYGFLALALGGWTGNDGLAAGVAAGVMIVSYVAVGLLPLVEGLADAARLFPWYYLSGSQPSINGIHWGHVGILAGASAVCLIVAVVGVNRRDLRGRSVGRSMIDRLRSNPVTRRVVERLAGSAAVSRIWTRTVAEHQLLAIIAVYVMLLMGALMGPMYSLIPAEFLDFADQLPRELLALVGSGNMSTPEGWYQLESFSLMVPVTLMIVTIWVGARALAGEEASRTMGLLLSNPVRRRRVVIEKALAMVLLATAVGVATFVGTAIGSAIPGLGMDVGNIAATSLLATLLGLVVGGLALLFGAATGRVRTAVQGAAVVALVAYLLNSFLPLNDSVAGFAQLSPFYYYLTSQPLANGLPWGHAVLLAGLFVGLVIGAVGLFDRRDLRRAS